MMGVKDAEMTVHSSQDVAAVVKSSITVRAATQMIDTEMADTAGPR